MGDKKNNNWFLWILLVFLSPIGIIYMWVTKKEFTNKKKSILTTVFTIWFICILLNIDDNSTKVTDMQETQVPVHTNVSSSPELTAKPETTQEYGVEEIENSDLTLITKPNHPVLFSSTESAHEFWGDEKGVLGWKDREDKKISYPDTTTNSLGSGIDWEPCILEMGNDMNFGIYNSDYIFSIHIYLDKFEKSADLKLNESLELASSYLPYDTLKSYYKFNGSTSYKATKVSKKKDYYYDISYSPINETQQNFVLGNCSYSYPIINITLRGNKKKYITDIYIDLHQSICNSGRNSIAYGGDYKKIKWNYNFLDK